MDTAVIVAIIACVQAVSVAVIGGIFTHYTKRAEKRADILRADDMDYRRRREERDKAREVRDADLYDLLFATASGTEVLLHQAHGERVNGNVDEALQEIREAKAECNRVFNRSAAKL